MKPKKHAAVYVLTASFVCLAWCSSASWGHDNSSTVSMVNLRTSAGPNGQEMVTTPSGKVVPLPGAGVNGSTVDIYMGSEGGYWYVDRNGQNFDLTPYVQQLHAVEGQSGTGQSSNTPSSNSSGNSSNSGSTGETAAAAGLGAMAGAAAGSAYSQYQTQNSGYQIPYGAAVFYGGGRPYYNGANGSSVYVNNSQSANVSGVNSSNLKAQQQWYDQQRQTNPSGFKSWQQNSPKENPFVATNSGQLSGGKEGHRGPFGGRGGPGGGPFAGKEPPSGGGHSGGPFAGKGAPSGGPFAGKEPPGGGGAGASELAGKGPHRGGPGGGPFAGKEPPSGGGPGGGPFAAGGGPKGKPPVRGGAGPRPPIGGGGMPHP